MERPPKRHRVVGPYLPQSRGPFLRPSGASKAISDEEKILRLEYQLRLLAKVERREHECPRKPVGHRANNKTQHKEASSASTAQSDRRGLPSGSFRPQNVAPHVKPLEFAENPPSSIASERLTRPKSDGNPRRKIATVCRYLLNFGDCAKGDACAFFHPSGDTKDICIKFLAGECFVDDCDKKHWWPEGWIKPACRRWMDGMCLKDEKDCHFAHVICTKTRNKPWRSSSSSSTERTELEKTTSSAEGKSVSCSAGSVAGKSHKDVTLSRKGSPERVSPSRNRDTDLRLVNVGLDNFDAPKPLQRYWEDENSQPDESPPGLQWFM